MDSGFAAEVRRSKSKGEKNSKMDPAKVAMSLSAKEIGICARMHDARSPNF